MKNKKQNYFERVYLKKEDNAEIAPKESQRLRKLVRKTKTSVQKVNLIELRTKKATTVFVTDIDSFLLPFDF